METRMKPGDVVRHFKGNRYQILYFAKDSETQEDVVVYRAAYTASQRDAPICARASRKSLCPMTTDCLSTPARVSRSPKRVSASCAERRSWLRTSWGFMPICSR